MHHCGVCQVLDDIEAAKVTPEQVAAHMVARVRVVDASSYMAYSHLIDADEVMRQAAQATASRGALAGVTVAVKDCIDVAGLATQCGSPMRSAHVASADATVVRRLREAGAVVLGKTRLAEHVFVTHHPALGTPLNPWSARHWCGVSSSGSAVAVASRQAQAALASDTGGSIRLPAAACGVTGVKPTWGRVSRHGVVELAASHDHVGVMARSALDCALVLRSIAGADTLDPTSSFEAVGDYAAAARADAKGLRIGYDGAFCAGIDGSVAQALEHVLRVLQDAGASMVPVSVPDVSPALESWGIAAGAEAAYAHRDTFPARREEYGAPIGGFLDMAQGITVPQLQEALRKRADFRGRMESVLQDVDVLLIPVMGVPLFEADDMPGMKDPNDPRGPLIKRFNMPFCVSQHPTITFPAGFTAEGLPIAAQLVARHWGEERLFRAAGAFQRATAHHERIPPNLP